MDVKISATNDLSEPWGLLPLVFHGSGVCVVHMHPFNNQKHATQPRAALRETTAKRSPLDAGTAMLLGCYIEFWAVEPQPPTLMQALRLPRSHIYRLVQQLGSLQGCATQITDGHVNIHIFVLRKKANTWGYTWHQNILRIIRTYLCIYIYTHTHVHT